MVQVDVFWSYGIGAGFAVANTWQLEAHEAAAKPATEHTSFRDALLFLGTLFVPSGAFLIWQFPSWETMHVGTRDIPGWLVAAFTMTNFTQGVLGYLVAAALLRRRQAFAAYMQWILGYFGMLFVLVHGWDGTGYMRFFSSTRADFLAGWTWATAQRWLTEDVAISLYTMGVVILPVMFWWMARDLRRGAAVGRAGRSGTTASASLAALMLSLFLILILGVLGTAIAASVAIRYLGPIAGTLVFAGVGYVALLRRGGLFNRHYRSVIHHEPFVG